MLKSSLSKPHSYRSLCDSNRYYTTTARSSTPRRSHQTRYMTSTQTHIPKLIAFDLDATLWYPEMDMTHGPPFRHHQEDSSVVVDRRSQPIELLQDSHQILHELATHEQWTETLVAYVSRTDFPKYASSCLKLFKITDDITMHELGQHQEIYPGKKTTHFRQIHQRTSIHYSDMLFFDNEYRNVEDVATLGVCSIYTPDGMTDDLFREGLQAFHDAKEALHKGEEPQLIAGEAKRGYYW